MRVFVAGATGVVGRPLVPMLVEAGHVAAGMTRDPAKLQAVEAMGATAYLANAFDLDAVARAVADFGPDVIVHEMTDLPDSALALPLKLAANNRIRIDGTNNLLAAAASAGCSRVVAQSIGFTVPAPARVGADYLEKAVLGFGGVVLRYGQFYGPGTWSKRPPKRGPGVHVGTAARRTVEHLDSPSGTYLITD